MNAIGQDLKLYGIPTCDTCRKARKALEEAGFAVSFVDLRKTPISEAERARFVETFGPALINRSSATWRKLSEAERAARPEALIAQQPTVMKRPVIETAEGALHLGWKPEVRQVFGLA